MPRLKKLRTKLGTKTGITTALILFFVIITLGLAVAIKYQLSAPLHSKQNPTSVATTNTGLSNVHSSQTTDQTTTPPPNNHPLTLGVRTATPQSKSKTTESGHDDSSDGKDDTKLDPCKNLVQAADQTYQAALDSAEKTFESDKDKLNDPIIHLTDTLGLSTLIDNFNHDVDTLYSNYLNSLAPQHCTADLSAPQHQ